MDIIFRKTAWNLCLAISFIVLFSVSACVSLKPEKTGEVEFSFALLGNTSPDSPFAGFSEFLDKTVVSINSENPLFVVHTGGIVYGGDSFFGIKPYDIRRQFRSFDSVMGALNRPLYTIPGENDRYNGSLSLYHDHTGRDGHYSFNFGSVHCVCLEVPEQGLFGDEDLQWLESDLEMHSSSMAVFLFAHHSFFKKTWLSKGNIEKTTIHELLKKHGVAAVFFGGSKSFTTVKIDGILYSITGCGGFTKEHPPGYHNQWYLVTYSDRECVIKPRKIKRT